jgi:D-glycero-alpha-D-manno-heptose 1-phosphate guanylyltransferase
VEAVILAGGLGTRLRAAVSDVPKPLAPVGGRPFLERLLDYWISQGLRRAVLAVGYKHELIAAHFRNAYRGCELAYSVEDRPLGTGGALLKALSGLRTESFLVLNGDTYFAVPLQLLRTFHQDKKARVTMSLFRSNNPRYTGVSVDAEGRVVSLAGGALANGGVFLFERTNLPQQAFNLEKDLLPKISDVYGRMFDAPFVDIGLPADWRAADIIISGG